MEVLLQVEALQREIHDRRVLLPEEVVLLEPCGFDEDTADAIAGFVTSKVTGDGIRKLPYNDIEAFQDF